MPKQTLNINRFEGGLNTDKNPRDLNDNELAGLKGAYVDKVGKIRTSGAISQYNSLAFNRHVGDSFGSVPTGYGLFQFGSDFDWEGVYSGNEIYTVLSEDEHLHIYDDAWESTDEQGVQSDDAGTTASTLELSSTAINKMGTTNFYYNNNALRCSTQSESGHVSSKWIGYIDNKYFNSIYDVSDNSIGTDNDYSKKGWFIVNQALDSPTEVFMDNQSSNTTNDITDANHWDEIDAANLISVSFEESAASTDNISQALKGTNWIFGVSYIYDGKFSDKENSNMMGIYSEYAQESPISILTVDHGNQQVKELNFSGYTRAAVIQVHFKASSSFNDAVNSQLIGINPRITGMRFYIKEFEGEGLQYIDRRTPIKPWLRVAEADLCTGVYTNFAYTSSNSLTIRRISSVNDTRGNTWNGSTGNGAEFIALGSESDAENNDNDNGILISTLPVESYYSLNGYHHYNLIECQYATSTVINHSAYIANIHDITNDKYYGDRLIRTPKFKLDTFSTDFFVDIIPGDGDSIIKLENYADRLLVYKTKKLFVVNVSQESMFIEQELNDLGVSFPSQIIKTDFGIMWCNSNGVYLFNGSKISNLVDNRIKTTWDSFYTEVGSGANITSSNAGTIHNTQIGYDPNSKHVVLLKSNNSGDGDCLIYDMKVNAWTYLDSLYTDNTDKTNFVISVDNNLILHEQDSSNNYILKYSDASSNIASGNFELQTKDFDFGSTDAKKTIYKVYVTYKTGGTTNVQVKFDTNGTTTFDKTFKDGENFASSELSNSGSGQFVRAELIPNNRNETKNIYSFALKFTNDGIVPSTFEISDISIVYRTKGIR